MARPVNEHSNSLRNMASAKSRGQNRKAEEQGELIGAASAIALPCPLRVKIKRSKTLPSRIELETFGFLFEGEYETNALPTEPQKQIHTEKNV